MCVYKDGCNEMYCDETLDATNIPFGTNIPIDNLTNSGTFFQSSFFLFFRLTPTLITRKITELSCSCLSGLNIIYKVGMDPFPLFPEFVYVIHIPTGSIDNDVKAAVHKITLTHAMRTLLPIHYHVVLPPSHNDVTLSKADHPGVKRHFLPELVTMTVAVDSIIMLLVT
jgi:hypothetical protein